jgi:proteic killer suppression protein
MEVTFAEAWLRELEDAEKSSVWPPAIVNVYQRRLAFIRAAPDERDFYAMKSLHYEKLAGDRSHQRSMRLNAKWRLILETREVESKRIIRVVNIEDYHQ